MSGALGFIDYITKGFRWVSSNDPLPVTMTGTGGGLVTVAGVNGSSVATVANPFPVAPIGGTAASRIPSSAANTNPTVAKASAGRAMLVNCYNSSATVTYLKLYNKATAPTVGTDVPVLTLALPPASVCVYDLNGFVFATGISYGLTTDAADAGTTAVAAGAILGVNVAYV